ncbi:hypothetical protein GALMADRAFT_229915 [Galerina marginata CBS 339.88]|uniref:CBM1 domain-containing protein n=1 Tax=Galerina marginata (strain CBS 339.88) TaxID=685588 RepID=A0A067STH2_GALM3|nr:hypothetical protein GALMADRAFT_229915 [Galerina marginata CBS 339.88]
MFSIKSLLYATLAFISTQVLATPSPQAGGLVLRCPPLFTCCGPITQAGGTCRLLGKNEVCAF